MGGSHAPPQPERIPAARKRQWGPGTRPPHENPSTATTRNAFAHNAAVAIVPRRQRREDGGSINQTAMYGRIDGHDYVPSIYLTMLYQTLITLNIPTWQIIFRTGRTVRAGGSLDVSRWFVGLIPILYSCISA